MANDDDLLDPAEIEALLSSAGGGAQGAGAAPAAGGASAKPPTAATGQQLSSSDIDALLEQRQPHAAQADPAALLERATAGLAAAVAPNFPGPNFPGPADSARGAKPFEFQPFDNGAGSGPGGELNNLKDVELDLRIELGRTELLIDEVLKLREGSVVTLDKLAGDPVDVLVNGRLVARGEVLVLNDNFCVRIAEILAPALE